MIVPSGKNNAVPGRFLALAVAASLLLPSPAPARARPPGPATLGALDVIALEICYTTVMARYYKPVDPALLLAGARTGIVAYLVGRGITQPVVPPLPPHVDRYRAESEIDREVALTLARYGARVRTADLVTRTIEGELAALHDPYSMLFRPAAFKKFVGFLDGRPAAGIGAELDVDPQTHVVRVVDVFPGSPAEMAGLAPGDAITAIDAVPPPGAPAAVAAALRGAPGTTVRISFLRGDAPHEPLAIVRAIVSAPDVTGRMVGSGIGYVRIRSFGAQSAHQLDAALGRLRAAHARAFIVDLRANGGGYRDAAISIGSRFVRGTIVTTQERTGAPRPFAGKSAGTPSLDAPLAVLVDGDTASAAEIVAGAIQDARAGTLVGTRTFGKGLVQETFPLPDGGAIKLTTARYVTPAGRDIDAVGITPDIIVSQTVGAHPGEPGRDPQLDRALAVVEERASDPAPRSAP